MKKKIIKIKKQKPVISKFIEPITLPKEIDKTMDRENKKDFVNFLQEKMKEQEMSIKFNEVMSAGGSLSGMGAGVVSNPEVISFDDLRKMRKDYQIALGMAFIKMPIIAQNFSVFCQDPMVKAFVAQTIRPLFRKVVRSLLLALDYGFSPHEKVFERKNVMIMNEGPDRNINSEILYEGDAIVYKKIKSINPDSVSIMVDSLDNFDGLSQNTTGTETNLKSNECVLYSNDLEFSNFYGKSRLISAYPMWYYKILMLQFMLKYFERKGSPPIIVEAPPGFSEDAAGARHSNLDIALKLGKSLLSNTVGVLPYTESKNGNQQWKLNYLMDDKRGDQFVSVINLLDVLSLRGVLVPERVITQDIRGTGSYAMTNTHANMFFLSEDAVIADIESVFNEQIIPQLVSYNFPKQPPCYMTIDRIEFERKRMLNGLMITIFNKMDTFIKEFGKAPFDVFPSLLKIGEDLGLPMEKIRLYDLMKPEELEKIKDSKKKNKTKPKNDNGVDDSADMTDVVENLIKETSNLPVKVY